LITLADEFSEVDNVHLDAVEHQNGVVFLHAVKEGPANQSYGLEVAALAGVPKVVLRRAREKLVSLERKTAQEQGARPGLRQLDLFESQAPDPALELLDTIDPDSVTPREALDLLFRLKLARKLP